jgi:hypothetical protein
MTQYANGSRSEFAVVRSLIEAEFATPIVPVLSFDMRVVN